MPKALHGGTKKLFFLNHIQKIIKRSFNLKINILQNTTIFVVDALVTKLLNFFMRKGIIRRVKHCKKYIPSNLLWLVSLLLIGWFTMPQSVQAQDSSATPTTNTPTEQPVPTPTPAEQVNPATTPTNPSNSQTPPPSSQPTTNTQPTNTPTTPSNANNRPVQPRPTVPREPTNNNTNNSIENDNSTSPPSESPPNNTNLALLDNDNPFELVDYGNSRSTNTSDTDNEEEAITSNAPRDTVINYDNPFELVSNGRTNGETPVASNGSSTTKKIKKKARKRKSKPLFNDAELNYDAIIRFAALLIIAIFLAFLTSTYNADLQKISRAFQNSNMMTQLYRDKPSLLQMPYPLLYALFVLTSGAFLYLTLDYFNQIPNDNRSTALLMCIGSVTGFYLFKHILLKLIGLIFPFRAEINSYHFTLGIFNQVIGLVLIPLLMLVAFAPNNIRLFAIYGALIIISIILLFRFIRTIPLTQRFMAFHKFHLIVYLCTVEIAPILIIIKLILG